MKTEHPNIVLITIDECKASALSCYGNEKAYTPNMDRMAEEGVQFNNTYTVMPKCVPSRVAMMTGRYPHTDGHRTLPGFCLRKGENNLMLELKKFGYRTAIFGGLHHTVNAEIEDKCFDQVKEEWEARSVSDTTEKKDQELFRAMYRTTNFGIEFDENDNEDIIKKDMFENIDEENKVIKSNTGELEWDYEEGVIKIDTERTQGTLGFIDDKKIQLNNVEFQADSPFSAIFFSSLTKDSLKSTNHILITLVGRTGNKNMEYEEKDNGDFVLNDTGENTIVMEPIKIKGNLDSECQQFKGYALDVNGKRKEQIDKVESKDGIFSFQFNTGDDKVVYYELVGKKSSKDY